MARSGGEIELPWQWFDRYTVREKKRRKDNFGHLCRFPTNGFGFSKSSTTDWCQKIAATSKKPKCTWNSNLAHGLWRPLGGVSGWYSAIPRGPLGCMILYFTSEAGICLSRKPDFRWVGPYGNLWGLTELFWFTKFNVSFNRSAFPRSSNTALWVSCKRGATVGDILLPSPQSDFARCHHLADGQFRSASRFAWLT